ncbi:hypothetical protein RI367_001423 [Sorochytrium milnesiophthora]
MSTIAAPAPAHTAQPSGVVPMQMQSVAYPPSRCKFCGASYEQPLIDSRISTRGINHNTAMKGDSTEQQQQQQQQPMVEAAPTYAAQQQALYPTATGPASPVPQQSAATLASPDPVAQAVSMQYSSVTALQPQSVAYAAPTVYQCKYCMALFELPLVESRISTRGIIGAAALCLVGCWPCACCIFCMDDCNEKVRQCPKCKGNLDQTVG